MVSSSGFLLEMQFDCLYDPKVQGIYPPDLSKLELDGHALINVHVAGYFYVPTIRWPVTHPRQLAACVLKGDGDAGGALGLLELPNSGRSQLSASHRKCDFFHREGAVLPLVVESRLSNPVGLLL